jgi:hypothetical protein
VAFAVHTPARHPLFPPNGGSLTTLAQASLALQTGRSLGPASHPASRPRTGASLPRTRASPRTGLTPAGRPEPVARIYVMSNSFSSWRPSSLGARMDRSSGSVTAAFHGCRSEEWSGCAPADARPRPRRASRDDRRDARWADGCDGRSRMWAARGPGLGWGRLGLLSPRVSSLGSACEGLDVVADLAEWEPGAIHGVDEVWNEFRERRAGFDRARHNRERAW